MYCSVTIANISIFLQTLWFKISKVHVDFFIKIHHMEFPTWTHGPTTRNRRSMLHLSLSSGRASSRSSMKVLLYFITWNSLYRRKSLIKIRSHQWLTVWLLTQLDDSQDSVMSFIRNSASVYFFKSISNRGKICKKKLCFSLFKILSIWESFFKI